MAPLKGLCVRNKQKANIVEPLLLIIHTRKNKDPKKPPSLRYQLRGTCAEHPDANGVKVVRKEDMKK
jgi:hypothetical protein